MTQPPRLSPEVLQYDRPTILLHWTTAILVGVLWIIGQTIDYWPKGPLKVDYRSVHIVCGVLLACVLATRIVWRLTRGLVLPPDRHRLLAFGAKVIHVALYLLIAATIGLGVTTAWAQGDSLFNLFSIPSFAPGNRTLGQSIRGWHELAANTVLVVAALHAAAALSHHYVLRDDILARMAPALRRHR